MGKYRDLTGQQFGRLTVLRRVLKGEGKTATQKGVFWECQCCCGNIVEEPTYNLTSGIVVSCGCYHSEVSKRVNLKHGRTDSRLYYVWSSMKSRCTNPNVPSFRTYGGRGIHLCDEWNNDFAAFERWAIDHGYDENAPRGKCSVDRIDPNGNYEPSNCRIITMLEQSNNRRTNRFLEYNGQRHTVAEWSRITGIKQAKIRRRIDVQHWSVERALTTA